MRMDHLHVCFLGTLYLFPNQHPSFLFLALISTMFLQYHLQLLYVRHPDTLYLQVASNASLPTETLSRSHRIASSSPSSSSGNLNDLNSHLSSASNASLPTETLSRSSSPSSSSGNLNDLNSQSVVQYLIHCVEQKVKYQTESEILKGRLTSVEKKNADLFDELAAKELRYQFALSELAETNLLLKEAQSKLLHLPVNQDNSKSPSSIATKLTQTTSYSDAVSSPLNITSAKQSTTAPSSVLQHFTDAVETEPSTAATAPTNIPPSTVASNHLLNTTTTEYL